MTSEFLTRVEELDGLRTVHHTRYGLVEGLSTEGCPNTCAKGNFGGRALETQEVEWELIGLRLNLLVVDKGVDALEHGGLLSEDHRLTKFCRSMGCSCWRHTESDESHKEADDTNIHDSVFDDLQRHRLA